jgi:uncharacterized protein YraI
MLGRDTRRPGALASSALFLLSALALVGDIDVRRAVAQSSGTYRVVHVASNDVLNLRSDPGTAHAIVGILPPNATGIKVVGPCAEGWCVVQHGSASGWANMKFLAAEGPVAPLARTCHIVGVSHNDVLNMRAGPASDRHAIVGFIPPNGRGIALKETAGTWSQVEYHGTVGWVSGRYLACP